MSCFRIEFCLNSTLKSRIIPFNGIYIGTKPRGTNLLAMFMFLKKQGFHKLFICNYKSNIFSWYLQFRGILKIAFPDPVRRL